MKLDRNISSDGAGKYALVKLRVLRDIRDHHDGQLPKSLSEALALLEQAGVIDFGNVGTESEFFVMRLKDKYAYRGLTGYLRAIEQENVPDHEYAQEILDMARRAGPNSPFCKMPD